MKKLLSILTVLFVVGTVNLFAVGLGAQGGYSVAESGCPNGALTFKVDSLPCVFAVDANLSEITTLGVTADWWIANPKIEGTWGYYYGIGLAGSFASVKDSTTIAVGGRGLVGTNVFLLDDFFELYLQAAWQPMFKIGSKGGFISSFPVNLGFRLWF